MVTPGLGTELPLGVLQLSLGSPDFQAMHHTTNPFCLFNGCELLPHASGGSFFLPLNRVGDMEPLPSVQCHAALGKFFHVSVAVLLCIMGYMYPRLRTTILEKNLIHIR